MASPISPVTESGDRRSRRGAKAIDRPVASILWVPETGSTGKGDVIGTGAPASRVRVLHRRVSGASSAGLTDRARPSP